MKEIWCEKYNELEAEFEEIHGRPPELEEEFELAMKADDEFLSLCEDIGDYATEEEKYARLLA